MNVGDYLNNCYTAINGYNVYANHKTISQHDDTVQ